MVIALPLCEPLAAELDQQKGGQEIDIPFLTSLLSGLSLSLKLLFVGLSVSLVLTILSFIPVIGFFALPLQCPILDTFLILLF